MNYQWTKTITLIVPILVVFIFVGAWGAYNKESAKKNLCRELGGVSVRSTVRWYCIKKEAIIGIE